MRPKKAPHKPQHHTSYYSSSIDGLHSMQGIREMECDMMSHLRACHSDKDKILSGLAEETERHTMNTSLNDPASLLLVDDNVTFCQVLAQALERRGYQVTVAHSVEEATPLAMANPPEYAVIDLKMTGASGLTLVRLLHELDPVTYIVVLTGYASIATAVEAIKLGATQYLSKPANADEIVSAFGHVADAEVAPNLQPNSVERVEWEHIQRVLQEHQGNVSATARALNMHRRTLQRKLNKHPAS